MLYIFIVGLRKEYGKKYGNEKVKKEDCGIDTLLIKVNPVGPVCHKGDDTCFEEINKLTLY